MLIRLDQHGVTLVELMIGLTIVAMVLFVAVPSFGIFLQNSQIRNAASSVLDGLQLARNEAIRRNSPVRFQFVSNLTSGCALSATSLAWVVSQSNPTGACNAAPSDDPLLGQPLIIQSRSASEGTSNARLTVAGGSTVVFTGLGRVQGAGITQIDVTNTSGTCIYADPAHGSMRCMRILVSSGGQSRMCDPQVTAANDPRKC
jgi:type IV fimbrial biogenesis protein FimT